MSLIMYFDSILSNTLAVFSRPEIFLKSDNSSGGFFFGTGVTLSILNTAGLMKFSSWVESCSWEEIYKCADPNTKAELFQNALAAKYIECFPAKIQKVAEDDKPCFTSELKLLDRLRKREYFKHQKSEKWSKLNAKYLEKCQKVKESYYKNMVQDLKDSKPGQWHSKIKRLSGQENDRNSKISIEILENLTPQEQANAIADHYAVIANEYEPIDKKDFPEYNQTFKPPTVYPWEVYRIIESLNKKSATVPGDIPVKLFMEFSVELATPLAHIYNSCLEHGTYPSVFKICLLYTSPSPRDS